MAYIEGQTGGILSNAQALSASGASTNIFDVTGAGSGNPPNMIGNAGLATNLGTDLGIGQNQAHPGVLFTVTTAGTGTGTFAFGIEAAPDNGSYAPGTYTRLITSGAKAGLATLTVGYSLYLPLPPIPPEFAGLPRFYRAYYDLTNAATVSVTATLLMNNQNVKSVLDSVKNFNSAY
jgi:hypothetical protein